MGDDVISKVDIVKEAGKGEILNKWIEFELRDDVIYINKTTVLPSLPSQSSTVTSTPSKP